MTLFEWVAFDPDYRRMYGDYLRMRGYEPPRLLIRRLMDEAYEALLELAGVRE